MNKVEEILKKIEHLSSEDKRILSKKLNIILDNEYDSDVRKFAAENLHQIAGKIKVDILFIEYESYEDNSVDYIIILGGSCDKSLLYDFSDKFYSKFERFIAVYQKRRR